METGGGGRGRGTFLPTNPRARSAEDFSARPRVRLVLRVDVHALAGEERVQHDLELERFPRHALLAVSEVPEHRPRERSRGVVLVEVLDDFVERRRVELDLE